jgi:hypothetical protein
MRHIISGRVFLCFLKLSWIRNQDYTPLPLFSWSSFAVICFVFVVWLFYSQGDPGLPSADHTKRADDVTLYRPRLRNVTRSQNANQTAVVSLARDAYDLDMVQFVIMAVHEEVLVDIAALGLVSLRILSVPRPTSSRLANFRTYEPSKWIPIRLYAQKFRIYNSKVESICLQSLKMLL